MVYSTSSLHLGRRQPLPSMSPREPSSTVYLSTFVPRFGKIKPGASLTNGMTPGPECAPGRIRRASLCEVAAWILSGVSLFLVLRLGLLPGLLSGLMVYELVHIIAPRLSKRLAGEHARVLAVALLAAVVAGVFT